jgi:outer membrane protein insertion porin family
MLNFFQIKPANFLLFIFLTVTALSSNSIAQRVKFVETLDIQGNRRLSDEELLKHIKTRSGERLNEEKLQIDLKSLLELGFFNATHTRVLTEEGVRGGVNVIFEVRELPIIVELKFEGLKYTTKEEIIDLLREQKLEIKTGSAYQPEKMRKAHKVILEYLIKKRGLTGAKLDFTEQEVSATTLIIAFVFDEMPNDDFEDW